MQSVRVMMWVSVLMGTAILGMGGAPIAEKFGPEWMVTVLTWISYVSVGLLAIAAVFIGGLGAWHGLLVILGRDIGTVSQPGAAPAPLPSKPTVEAPPSAGP